MSQESITCNIRFEFVPTINVESFKGVKEGANKRLTLVDYRTAIESELAKARAAKKAIMGEGKSLYNPLVAFSATLEEGDNDSNVILDSSVLPSGAKLGHIELNVSQSVAKSTVILLDEVTDGKSDKERKGLGLKQAQRFHKSISETFVANTERRKGFVTVQGLFTDDGGVMENICNLLDSATTKALKKDFVGANQDVQAVCEITGLDNDYIGKVVQAAIYGRGVRGLQSQLSKAATEYDLKPQAKAATANAANKAK